MERLYKPGGEETRRMAIKGTNTRYGRETCDEVERKIVTEFGNKFPF